MSPVDEIKIEDGYIRATMKPDFGLDYFRHVLLRISDASSLHDLGKVLIDGRDVVLKADFTVLELYEVAQFIRDTFTRGSHRIALVAKPEHITPDKFVENVAVNRGLNLKAFSDIDAAREWLGVL